MTRTVELEVSSRLDAPVGVVWSHASSMAGVNAELSPWVRMTYPAAFASLSDVSDHRRDELLGRVAFRSWLLALGVVPFDRHSLRLRSVETTADGGGSFVEDSTTWMQRRWRHEREVVGRADGGCTVTDRLLVEPRLGPAVPVVARLVPWLFERRHRVLRTRFG